MIKGRITSSLLILLLLISTMSLSYGAKTSQYLEEAKTLNDLSVLEGSKIGFELNRQPNRIEAGIILVRLIGGEEEALSNEYPHPFTDVPKWGKDYVGFLYHHNLIKGINETEFGSREIINSSSFMTMALRSLGYMDGGQDFIWRNSLDKALDLEVIDQAFYKDLKEDEFLRNHLVKISYNLLQQTKKGETLTLIDKLMSNKNTPQYLEEARKLNVLSIFQGSEKGFELERSPSRIEAGIILVRLVGGEKEALANNYPHPFTDVPKWGKDYVGFLCKHNLIKGISETEFGSHKVVRTAAYMTMALRTIGYQDNNVDFYWRNSLEKALELELIDQEFYEDLKKNEFLRDHVVKISYNLLSQAVKGDTATLADKLISYGTFTKELLEEMENLEPEEAESIEGDSENLVSDDSLADDESEERE